VFIVEFRILSTIKKPLIYMYMYMYMYVYMEFFSLFWCEELNIGICPSILDTPRVSLFNSKVQLSLQ
jgi:hypothetical protein